MLSSPPSAHEDALTQCSPHIQLDTLFLIGIIITCFESGNTYLVWNEKIEWKLFYFFKWMNPFHLLLSLPIHTIWAITITKSGWKIFCILLTHIPYIYLPFPNRFIRDGNNNKSSKKWMPIRAVVLVVVNISTYTFVLLPAAAYKLFGRQLGVSGVASLSPACCVRLALLFLCYANSWTLIRPQRTRTIIRLVLLRPLPPSC